MRRRQLLKTERSNWILILPDGRYYNGLNRNMNTLSFPVGQHINLNHVIT